MKERRSSIASFGGNSDSRRSSTDSTSSQNLKPFGGWKSSSPKILIGEDFEGKDEALLVLLC